MDIPGYVGIYQASDYGRIRSLPRFNGHYRTTGKVRKTCLMSCGHLSIQLCKQENWLVHRLVVLAWLGPCPPGLEVLHLNHNPADNRIANLKYGTRSENIRADFARGHRKANPAWVYSQVGRKNKEQMCSM